MEKILLRLLHPLFLIFFEILGTFVPVFDGIDPAPPILELSMRLSRIARSSQPSQSIFCVILGSAHPVNGQTQQPRKSAPIRQNGSLVLLMDATSVHPMAIRASRSMFG